MPLGSPCYGWAVFMVTQLPLECPWGSFRGFQGEDWWWVGVMAWLGTVDWANLRQPHYNDGLILYLKPQEAPLEHGIQVLGELAEQECQ